jgi:hypothetical protein
LFRGVTDILQLLSSALPPWAVTTILVVVVLLVLPAWIRSGRSKQIRGDIRRMFRASEPRRSQLGEAVLYRAGTDKHLLELTVKEARRREQYALAKTALERLTPLAGSTEYVERLEQPPTPPKPEKRWGHPIEAAAAIQALLDIGAVAAAEARLAEVRERFPEDDDLRELEETVHTRRTVGGH